MAAYKKAFLCVFTVLVSYLTCIPSSYAEEKTLPFIVEDRSYDYRSIYNYRGEIAQLTDKKNTASVPVSLINDVIETIRGDLCKGNPGGEFEVSLNVDFNTGVIGIGVSGSGGLKIKIPCKDRKR